MMLPFGKPTQDPLVKRLRHSQVHPKPHHPLHTNEGNLKPLKSRQRYPRWEEPRGSFCPRMNSNIVRRIGYVSCARWMTRDCWISKIPPKPFTSKYDKK